MFLKYFEYHKTILIYALTNETGYIDLKKVYPTLRIV